ncbi:MAG TPA: hypothetical protein VGL83_05495 [Stellaceae bacterium]
MRLVADRLEARDALLQPRVVEIGDAGLDGIIEPFESQAGFGRPLVQFGDVLAAALGSFLPAVENGRQHLLEPLRLKQPIGDVLGDQAVQPRHRYRAALAAGLALPGLDRAGVIAIPPSLSGPERHSAAAGGAKADARKVGRAAHDARWRDLWTACAQMRLHRIERRFVDQRRHLDGNDFARRLERLILGAPIELVPANVGRSRQDAVNLPDAPAPAVASEDAALVEVSRDVLNAHRTARAVAFQG